MTLDFAAADYVRQLRRVGLRPTEKLADQIVRAGAAAVSPLLELATDQPLLDRDPPECYGPIHAMRLLSELHPIQMLEPLIEAYIFSPHENPQRSLWRGEMVIAASRIGVEAHERLWTVADDESMHMDKRVLGLMALASATVAAADQKQPIMDALEQRLDASTDSTFRAHLVAALANIGAEHLYSKIMRLYRENAINSDVIPASRARQFLLSRDAERFPGVKLSLWERYNRYGPFEPSDFEDDDDLEDEDLF